MTATTFAPNTRVRLTSPGVYPDHDGLTRRLGTHLVFRVLDQTEGVVLAAHDQSGRRYVLPASKLTRVV